MLIICVSGEGHVLNRHLPVNDLVSNWNRLVGVYNFLGKCAFDGVSSENDAIFLVRGPLDEKFSGRAVLEHTW